MAESEFEYFKYTYAHNILKLENMQCADQICYCLDNLQLSLLLLILNQQDIFPKGTMFDFYRIVHIRIKECYLDILELEKCDNNRVEKYKDEKIYFDNAKRVDDITDPDNISNLTLEKQAINLLATALYIIIEKYSETEDAGTGIWKDRNFDYILLDMEFLNPKLMVLVVFNMFYGFLLSFISQKLSGDRKNVVDRYVMLLNRVRKCLTEREIRTFRKDILKKYNSVFKGETYNRISYEERIPRYMYGVILEKNRTEEAEILGHLDFLCAIMQVFHDKFLKDNTEWSETFMGYIDDIKKVMMANITQDPMYLQAQYYDNTLKKLSKPENFKRELENYCEVYSLFLVGNGSPVPEDTVSPQPEDKAIKDHQGKDVKNKKHKHGRRLKNPFRRKKKR